MTKTVPLTSSTQILFSKFKQSLHFLQKDVVHGAEYDSFLISQPHGKPTIVPLSTHIRPKAQIYEYSSRFTDLKEPHQVGRTSISWEVKMSFLWLVNVPEHINLDQVDAAVCVEEKEEKEEGLEG